MPDATAAWIDRYMTFLGVERAALSLDALSELTRAQLRAVTFENVTSLLRRAGTPTGPVPDLEFDALLRNWEEARGGGVCFEIAGMFGRLLDGLGYRVTPVLGQISFPGSHQALLVQLEDARYLVDVGNGAPIFAPIPLDAAVEVRHAGLAYRFRSGNKEESWIQDRWIAGAWEPFCRYDLRPTTADERRAAYQLHHAVGESWVVGEPRLIRCEENAVFLLRNGEFQRFTSEGRQSEPVGGETRLAQLAAEVFRLPALPLANANRARAELAGVAIRAV